MMRMFGHQNTGQFWQQLQWRIPGSDSSYKFIDSSVAVAFQAPTAYISLNNTISFTAQNGVQVSA